MVPAIALLKTGSKTHEPSMQRKKINEHGKSPLPSTPVAQVVDICLFDGLPHAVLPARLCE